MSKAQERWGVVEKVFVKVGVNVQAREMIHKAVLQTLFI